MWGVGAVFGPVVGPILGSMATEAWNWRAAFFLIIPPGICALACTWFALAGHTERRSVRFDWIGFAALSVAMIAAQLVLDRGHRLDWFESTEIVLCVVVGALSFWVFCAHCLTARQPFLNPRLLLDRNFSIGLALSFVMGMLSFTSLTLFPTLLHDLRGYPSDAIGLLIAARGMGNWLAFLVVARLTRLAPRATIAAGMALQAAAAFWMASLDINMTEDQVFWSNLLQGFGQSIAFTPIAVMAFSTLPVQHVTEGSAVFTLMRNFGSSLFISLSVLVAIRSTTANYARLTEMITPYNEALVFPGLPGQWELGSVGGLLRLSNEVMRQAAMIGYVNAFPVMAFTAAASVPLAWLMGRPARGPAGGRQ
jgi:DHA2 family multidrug resistance protein